MKPEQRTSIQNKMRSENLSDEFIEEFLTRVQQVIDGETGIVQWDQVGDLDPKEDEIPLEEIQSKYKYTSEDIGKLVVMKLNGGLGTSMGLSKAKSLISIKDQMSFLHVIASQIQFIRKHLGCEVPLLFMDSYNTQTDSQEELKKIGFTQYFPSTFLQHKVPRLLKDELVPVSLSNPYEEWCPPGHGDIYFTMKETGLLDDLLNKGYEIAFISNGDNLGATVEPHIVKFMLQEGLDFAMEMTPKTLADKKGGAIYRKMVNGKFQKYELLETAQVPKEHETEFSGLGKFRTFSTNNLWINLKSLKKRLDQGMLDLSLIVNPKSVEGKAILQLETAMGSAVGNFPKIRGIIIPRDRFAPVKKTEDYLIRRSDAYDLNPDFSLTMSQLRKKANLGEAVVTLDERFYKKIQDFDKLFAINPSLVYLEDLEVVGSVLFDTKVEILGKVKITNPHNSTVPISRLGKAVIPSGDYVLPTP